MRYDNLRLDTLLIYEQSHEYHAEIAAVIFIDEDKPMSLVNVFSASRGHARGINKELIFLHELEDSIKNGEKEYFPIYIKDYKSALNWLDTACDSSTPFLVPYWDFLLPSSIVDYVDIDNENFNSPKKWKNIFCSKFVLLFLRNCFYSGNLIVTANESHKSIINNNNDNLNKTNETIQKNKIEQLLWCKNSNRCTPADIVHIMQHYLTITLSN
jgi:hypothetical protein